MTDSPLPVSSRPQRIRSDRLCLNGEWTFMPDFEGRSPAELLASPQWEAQPVRVPSSWRWMIKPHEPFQPYDLFGYPAAWNDAQSGLLGRTFTVEPQGDASVAPDERVWLVFEGILQEWVIFVNGERVAEGSEGFLPVEVDITAHVRPGEANELAVWCGAWRSVETETGPKLLVPEGSWFARLARGIWQDVFLEVRPPVAVEDVFVQTSVRRGELSARVRVSSADGSSQPGADPVEEPASWLGQKPAKAGSNTFTDPMYQFRSPWVSQFGVFTSAANGATINKSLAVAPGGLDRSVEPSGNYCDFSLTPR